MTTIYLIEGLFGDIRAAVTDKTLAEQLNRLSGGSKLHVIKLNHVDAGFLEFAKEIGVDLNLKDIL